MSDSFTKDTLKHAFSPYFGHADVYVIVQGYALYTLGVIMNCR
jgi:hypothetical protein